LNKYSSLIALILCIGIELFFGTVFYPKYDQSRTEATIGWDVSGYYFYLPAIFIYKDIKQLKFKDDILNKYGPTPNLQQAYLHDSGNYIMKYSLGQSIHYLPWFGLAHIWATHSSEYAPDGFSYPYQVMLTLGRLFLSFLGIWILRKVLLNFYSDKTTALSLICIVLGSNYLDYAAINGAMAHNSLFTLYAFLLYLTIKFYKSPKTIWAVLIGITIGWMALIRPTEIIALLIPLFWGLKGINKTKIVRHLEFIRSHFKYIIFAGIFVGAIGFLQLLYWKFVGGEWVIYSYQDQGFDWFKPHFKKGIFSYKTGWLVYSPVFLLSIAGFYFLIKEKREGYLGLTLFSAVFIYLCFAWQEWWYGGSLGIRAMIQSYPILAFPMAACIEKMFKKRTWTILVVLATLLFVSYNFWLTRHAHKGGVLHVGQMTKAYFWKVLGKSNVDQDALKLLDTDEEYLGKRKLVKELYVNQFEMSDSLCNNMKAINGNGSLCLSKGKELGPDIIFPLNDEKATWLRGLAKFKIQSKEWDIWRMTQFIIVALDASQKQIKRRAIRIQRHLNDGQERELYFDFSIPKLTKFVKVEFRNPQSGKPIFIDDLRIERFIED